MAILKSSSGIELNAAHSTSTHYGSRTFSFTKTVAASTNAEFLSVSQSSAVSSYRRNMGYVLYITAIRTSSTRTEVPAGVHTGLIYLNTNGTASHGGDTVLGRGGNLISALSILDSSGTITFRSSAATTGIDTGMHITFYCDSFDKVTFTIL